MREAAELVGYNVNGDIVYQETSSLGDYYDEEHPWDSTEHILTLGLSVLKGRLYGPDGSILQEFETAFSHETGEYIGSKAVHADGTLNVDGIYDVPD